MDSMQTEIAYLKGVGPERARLLKEELNIKTFQDLLHFFPNRYIDRSRFHPINQLWFFLIAFSRNPMGLFLRIRL